MNSYKAQYIRLLSNFFDSIHDVDTSGIPAPHIPSVGDLYDEAKYKIAFFGMETNGWGDLKSLKDEFIINPEKAFNYLTDDFRELAFLNWTNNFGTSFFNYILLFLSRFYNIKDWKAFKSDEQYQYILKTFIWGNTNAIERYEVSAKSKNVEIEAWNKVKSASKIFDSAEHILQSCSPNILLVMNWGESEKWLGNTVVSHKEQLGDHLYYLFSESTNTHIYWLAHPRWIAINVGFNQSIDSIFTDINKRNIHLDKQIIDPLLIKREYDKIADKKEYIGALAKFLNARKMKMSGYELAAHLNRNGFKTSYNTRYEGTRGTHKLIRDCYNHYENLGKKDVAADIAESFTKENGEYAYL